LRKAKEDERLPEKSRACGSRKCISKSGTNNWGKGWWL